MILDYATLESQRRQHPAWRLLAADSAPLVASFLHRVFVVPNVRVMAQSNLAEALEDTLYALREQRGAQTFPKSAQEYLNDWAANDKGWLRKFYPQGSDEPHFDLTPPTERALLRDLARLNHVERALFDDLRYHRLLQNPGASLRLEQERVDFECLQRVLAALPTKESMETQAQVPNATN